MICFFFDFISPYSFLASTLIFRHYRNTPNTNAPLKELTIFYSPIVLGSLLSLRKVQGPGEIPLRRKQALYEIAALAEQYEITWKGPPRHPFNSLIALRTVRSIDDPTKRLELSQVYFDAAWRDGLNLEDPILLAELALSIGIEIDPDKVSSDATIRQALKQETREFFELGGYGVPSFQSKDIILFGHDRIELACKIERSEIKIPIEKIEETLKR